MGFEGRSDSVRRMSAHASRRLVLRSAMCWLSGLLLTLAGCWTKSGPEVVVYTALDAEFSAPIFADFEAASWETARRFIRDEFATGE